MVHAEIQAFTKTWLIAGTSLAFCHQFLRRIRGGSAARLLFILPVFYLLTTLPLQLTSFHLGGPTALYLVWLANSKLLLFAFNKGPLFSIPPLNLTHFVSAALLPIKITKHAQHKSGGGDDHQPRRRAYVIILYLVKCVALAGIVSLYRFREFMNRFLLLALYCCHVYLGVELVLALTAVPVRALLGLELEPQFDEPYLATSLQDFWGRRWNLMVSSILRSTVYEPVRYFCVTRIGLGTSWGRTAGLLMSFLVSGLMHEVIYYYMSRAGPTWEVTWFFLLQGFCVALEIWLKKKLRGRWRWNRVVSGVLTVGFVAVTGDWLFFPQIIRSGVDLKAIEEYYIAFNFVKNKLLLLYSTST